MNRIKYVDTLKFVAIFSIILLHITSIWAGIPILGLKFRNFMEFVQFGVPLFLLVSGMLLLNKEISLKHFFKKKFIRIVYPLVFFFIIAFLLNVYSKFLTTYWYCWMVIGVYFAVPLLNIIVKNANEKELEYFVFMILTASFLYTFAQFLDIKLALDLDFFIGPAALLILGYYLSVKEFNLSSNKMAILSLIVFALSSACKIRFPCSSFYNFNMIITSYLNLDIFHIIQAASVFLLFKNLHGSLSGIFNKVRIFLESKYVNLFILSISRSSYGIYLFHMILFRGYLEPYFENIKMSAFSTSILIIAISICLLLVSWIVIWILGHIPYLDKLSGYY